MVAETQSSMIRNSQVQFQVLGVESKISDMDYVIFLRPYLIQLFANLFIAKQFDLGVFSTGSKLYVDTVLRIIERYVFRYIGSQEGGQ